DPAHVASDDVVGQFPGVPQGAAGGGREERTHPPHQLVPGVDEVDGEHNDEDDPDQHFAYRDRTRPGAADQLAAVALDPLLGTGDPLVDELVVHPERGGDLLQGDHRLVDAGHDGVEPGDRGKHDEGDDASEDDDRAQHADGRGQPSSQSADPEPLGGWHEQRGDKDRENDGDGHHPDVDGAPEDERDHDADDEQPPGHVAGLAQQVVFDFGNGRRLFHHHADLPLGQSHAPGGLPQRP